MPLPENVAKIISSVREYCRRANQPTAADDLVRFVAARCQQIVHEATVANTVRADVVSQQIADEFGL